MITNFFSLPLASTLERFFPHAFIIHIGNRIYHTSCYQHIKVCTQDCTKSKRVHETREGGCSMQIENERGVANATCQRKMHKKYPHKLTIYTSDSECIYDRFMYALILCLKLIDACSIEKKLHIER